LVTAKYNYKNKMLSKIQNMNESSKSTRKVVINCIGDFKND
jgi:hypothetical protein